MQIGIVPVLSGHSGGIYQVSGNLLAALYQMQTADEFIVFTSDAAPLGFLGDEKEQWRVRPLEPFTIKRVLGKYADRLMGHPLSLNLWKAATPARMEEDEILDPDVVNYKPERGRWFAGNGVDLVLYPAPSALAFEAGIAYVVSVHHLQYRLYQEFPRYVEESALEYYEYVVRNTIRYATRIIVDSETIGNEILNRFEPYGVDSERIKLLPPLPAGYLDEEISEEARIEILSRYGVVEPYILYPAAYMPHKNPRGMLDALDVLEREYTLRIPVVFCGSTSGRIRGMIYRDICDEIEKRGRSDHVVCLRYVPGEHMSALFSGARLITVMNLFEGGSLVVPEAWAFRVPVIASRVSGISEQVGEAGMLVAPGSAEELAEAIRKLWTEPESRSRLARAGRQRHESYTPGDFGAKLAGILAEAKQIVESQYQ